MCPDRPVNWVGTARDDYRAFPDRVQDSFGYDLWKIQIGEMPIGAKPLHGFSVSGVYELRVQDRGGAYRVVLLARVAEAVYVLNCFQKKSSTGTKTPPQEIKLAQRRLDEVLRGRKK